MNKNSLSDLFETAEIEEIKQVKQNNVMIIDGNNLAYRTVFAAVFSDPNDNGVFNLWRHMFMTSIINLIEEFKPNKMILAFDVKNSWRYEVYADYKNKRKAARDKAAVDFEKFYVVFNKFKQDIRTTFKNIYSLEINRCEADDIIAVLSRDVFQDKNVLIVSSDSDMQQLLTMPNVKIYDAMKKTMIRSINPKKELELKILTGDKSDCIPAIKPRVGIVTAEALLNDGLQKLLDEDELVHQNYIRNTTLIDFSYIPQDIAKNIINIYNQYDIGQIDTSSLMKFFVSNRLPKLMEEWQSHSELIKKLS